MATIRIFLMLIIVGFIGMPPAHAQTHDWKLSETFGWYGLSYGDLWLKVVLHIDNNSITDFIDSPSIWLKTRGRFEKISWNQFILIPAEMTDAKGINLLANKAWSLFARVELPENKYPHPGIRAGIKVCHFLSLAAARASTKDCLGTSYSPIDPPFK